MGTKEYEIVTPGGAICSILEEYIEGNDIYLSYEPSGLKPSITVYDRGNFGNYFVGPDEPLIQIMVKNIDYNEGYNVARNINKVLDSLNDYTVDNIKIKAVHPTSGIIPLGWYEEGYHKFSINYRTYVVDSY